MGVLGPRAAKLALCAAAGLLAHCTTGSSTNSEAGVPDSGEEAEVSVEDAESGAIPRVADAEAGIAAPDSGEPADTSLDAAPVADSSVFDATDAIGAVDTTGAGAVEHVVPDGIYDCDVVQVRCNSDCLTPQLANADHNGTLLTFEMTLTGNSVVIPPDYACTGTWYAAGIPEEVLGFAFADGGGAAGWYDQGGFACQFPSEQGMVTCFTGGYTSCGATFVVEPNDPEPLRMNADGGAPQPGEIYVGLVNHNSYNAHCAPRH